MKYTIIDDTNNNNTIVLEMNKSLTDSVLKETFLNLSNEQKWLLFVNTVSNMNKEQKEKMLNTMYNSICQSELYDSLVYNEIEL